MPLTIACEEKSANKKAIATENTTELIAPQKDKPTEVAQKSTETTDTTKREAAEVTEKPMANKIFEAKQHPPQMPVPKAEVPIELPTTLIIKDINGKTLTINCSKRGLKIENMTQQDLMITLFASWCPPCKGALPYLQDIQSKHADQMFALGVLVNDNIDHDKLRDFLETHNVHFPATRNKSLAQAIIQSLHLPSNYPLPLTILYHDGSYVIHYEGATPPEMIAHDIETLKDR